jgi:hypothetical protein
MQQEQIPVPSAVNVPVISAAWRKAHAGCKFFQLFTVFQRDVECAMHISLH